MLTRRESMNSAPREVLPAESSHLCAAAISSPVTTDKTQRTYGAFISFRF
jgi:hypothetical protein